MEKDKYETIVVFRRWKKSVTVHKSVLALFPCSPADRMGHVMCYEHVGQHGAADYNYIVSMSTPASENDEDVKALKRELRNIGYKLVVRKRRPRRV